MSRSALVIGRDREVAELTRAIDAARASRGGAVFLVGEPGIGKSRLAVEAAGLAFTAGVRVLRGRGSTIGPTVPFRPLTEALLALFRAGRVPDDPVLGPYLPILGRLIPDLQQPGAAGTDSLVVLGEAVLRLVGVAGRTDGCLLVLEDLHNVDAETLAIVEYLVDNVADLPVLLLATMRNEACAAMDLARSAAQRHAASIIVLDRLTPADVGTLVASCLEADAAELPDDMVAQVVEDSAGIPFIVEELLHQLITDGVLAKGTSGWHVVGQARAVMPETVSRRVTDRAEQLGDRANQLLSVAAVLGDRFPLSVVGRVTALDERNMLSHLRAAVAAQLVAPDETSPDWYAFRHPLTAEALRTALTLADRVEYSQRAAAAIEALHPDLPGEWCQLTATLLADAGDAQGAARLFAEAGKRALSDGASESSVMLLDRANSLLRGEEATDTKVDVVQLLLYALAEAGEIERARALMDSLDEQAGAKLDSSQRAKLHTRLAQVYMTAGQPVEGMEQIDLARSVLGRAAGAENTAPIDVIAAHLTALGGGYNRSEKAEFLARRAIATAEPAGMAEVLCDAWMLIGNIARERSLDESTACFERTRALAEEHRLPIMRLYSLVSLTGNRWMATGDRGDVERTLQEAQRMGAVTIGYVIQGNLAIDATLRGDFAKATRIVEQNRPDVIRLGLRAQLQYLLMVKATVAAHQGKRANMERALAEFAEWEGDHTQEVPLAIGFARTFCALLEENREQARKELLRMLALTENIPTMYQLAGRHGLHLFLSVLERDAGWPEYEKTAARVPSTMRWNRQFVRLAEAVLLGRDGDAEAASAAVTAALDDSAIYPVAGRLGLRLVAEAAIADGWGDPVMWLRKAEEYFHQNSVAPVASACRSLLRHAGASVWQRRAGTDEVPDGLRALGVTVREHEVLQLLVERLTNKAIANRLHISPRTVEKHVASLILKVEVADRMELSNFAASAYADKQ
jgi:DNA-binding CsgD family transcriptional regulator/tetratricopeptide (TPR) repeat protein